ncbi:MAG: DinB family protein [Ilumatobacteraceae bacterium]
MDLRKWIVGEHEAVAERFARSIVAHVPTQRWVERSGEGGSSIAFLAFHVAYHEDLAVKAVLRDDTPCLAHWRQPLGLDGLATHVGLSEAEPPELTASLDLAHLPGYLHAVQEATADWLRDLDVDDLDRHPDAAAALAAAGVGDDTVPWLHAMWSGQPVSWFVQWEAVGHRVNHLGEMVSVRNRLGLSPF